MGHGAPHFAINLVPLSAETHGMRWGASRHWGGGIGLKSGEVNQGKRV